MHSKFKNVLFHIGMPKSASTTLQNQFFSKLKSVEYVGIGNKTTKEKQFYRLIHLHENRYNVEKASRILTQNQLNKDSIIFSSEIACSSWMPLSTGYCQPPNILARRFSNIFPDSTIFIVVRNQLDLLRSLYAQTLKSGSAFISSKKSKFANWVDMNIAIYERGGVSALDFCNYQLIYQTYSQYFDNFKIIVFEEMIKNFRQVLIQNLDDVIPISDEELAQLKFSKLNQRHTNSGIEIDGFLKNTISKLERMGAPQKILSKEARKRITKGIRKLGNGLDKESKLEFSDAQEQWLRKYFKESNQFISSLIDQDLTKYNYY